MAASRVSVYCLGCGEDLSNRGTDRRDFKNAERYLVDFWTSMISEKISDIGRIRECLERNKMCRGCYSNLTRLWKLRLEVGNRMETAVKVFNSMDEGQGSEQPPVAVLHTCSTPSLSVARSPISRSFNKSVEVCLEIIAKRVPY